ncbi:MAG TPA: GyrI-like domain-containing protein, partial [Chroococcidiopsis sp.]
VAFKDLGFSLEQIAQLLNDHVSPAQMRGMLRLKQAEVQQLVEAEQRRLRLIETRLQQIEQEEADIAANTAVNYEVVLKPIEAQVVVAIREVLPSCTDIKSLYDELATYLRSHRVERVGFPQTLWHDEDYRIEDVDAEVVIPIKEAIAGNSRIQCYRLPDVPQMACVTHHGSQDGLIHAFNALLNWIERNQFKIIGANREIYWQPQITEANFLAVNDLVDDLIIESQFPVSPASRMGN